MVDVYSGLKGFPSPAEQPGYYEKLANAGGLTQKPGTTLLAAFSITNELLGAVVYFSDMKYYGSGGTATKEKDAAGFRLLAVSIKARGKGLGRALTKACIQKARMQKQSQLIIHTTEVMEAAWNMYESLGFKRSEDLDFVWDTLPVLGFRLNIEPS